MSARLQQHFQQLREELAADTPLDADDRAALLELMQEIDLKLAKELASDPDATLVDVTEHDERGRRSIDAIPRRAR